MNKPLTNIHMHIFTSECAPPNFLRVQTSFLLKVLAPLLKPLVERDSVRRFLSRANWLLNLFGRANRHKIGRYIGFMDVASQYTEADIFRIALKAAKTHDPQPRLVALTLDMDHMDNCSEPVVNYQTQLARALHLKKLYPDTLFPFISADPRSRGGGELVRYVRPYFETGVKSHLKEGILPYCSGIKLYPAQGFFPFDPRLEELYRYAEAGGIPLIFHCTRVGSQYLGNNIEALIPPEPEMIMPVAGNPGQAEALAAKEEIHARIARYRAKGWIRNNTMGVNDNACDLFSHPQNYVPVLLKFPNLKICLAHMGGSTEVSYMDPDLADEKGRKASGHRRYRRLQETWKTDGHNWARLIRDLMVTHPNLYTDLSYTVADLDSGLVRTNIMRWLATTDLNHRELSERILFGTDFFLAEAEKGEPTLYQLILNTLPHHLHQLTRENPERFLQKTAAAV
jgi:uncharacterized protein